MDVTPAANCCEWLKNAKLERSTVPGHICRSSTPYDPAPPALAAFLIERKRHTIGEEAIPAVDRSQKVTEIYYDVEQAGHR